MPLDLRTNSFNHEPWCWVMSEWEHLIWMVRWKIPKCQTAHRLLLPWDSTVNISLISYPTRWYSHGDVTTVGKTSRHSGRIWSNQPGISGLLRFKLNSTLNIMSVPIFLKEKSDTIYHRPAPSKIKWPSSTRNIQKEKSHNKHLQKKGKKIRLYIKVTFCLLKSEYVLS